MNPKIIQLNTITLAILFAWLPSVNAQTSEEEELAAAYGDKTIVSIATGSSQPIIRAPSIATVITAQEIKAMGATNLDQVLESVPGLHVSVGVSSYDSRYELRGLSTERNSQALLLVNGRRMNTNYFSNRGAAWGVGMRPVDNIERIEVIRGPGSALYGADAFSGVINIITKTANDIKGLEVGVRLGSFNTKDAWIQYGGNLGPIETAFYLRVGKSDGQKGLVESDLQTILDSAFNTHVSNAPGSVSLSSKPVDMNLDLHYQDWRFRTSYTSNRVGIGVGLIEVLDPKARFPTSRLYMDLIYQKQNVLQNFDIIATAGYSDIHEDAATPIYTLFPAGAFNGAFPDGVQANPAHREKEMNTSVSTLYTGLTGHRIRAGLGYRKENLYQVTETKNFASVVIPGVGPVLQPLPGGLFDATGTPDVFLTPHQRHLTYAFLQDEWNFAKDFTLTAGVRKDRYSDFGNTTNPRVALVWDARYNLIVKLLHGRAFRSPSFIEQFGQKNPNSTGNPALAPETITTDELAFAYQPLPNLQTNLTFFRYREKSIIRLVPNANPTTGSTAQNTGDQTGRGFEFETTWDPVRNLRLSGNYSLQHSKDEATGTDAGLAPHRHVFLRADWRVLPTWVVGTTINYVADRKRQKDDPRPQIADYTNVDLILRREKLFGGNWSMRAGLLNMFNKESKSPTVSPTIKNDLPLAPRSFFIELQYSL